MTGPALNWEDLCESEGICVVFLNSGAGDGILIRLPKNRWIVIDANRVGNCVPAIEFLSHFAGDENQTVELVHLSHLHKDHYSGLAPLLAYLRERNQLPAYVRLPFSLNLLSRIAESSVADPDHDHRLLPDLVDELKKVKEAGTDVQLVQQGPFFDYCLFLLPSFRQSAASELIAGAYRLALEGAAADYVTSVGKELRRWEQQSSSVILIKCHDKLVLFGGDAPKNSWESLYPIPDNQPLWKTFCGDSPLPVMDEDSEGRYHFKSMCVLKVPHHGADRERIPSSLLTDILIGRGKFKYYPISVFLCDGRRHPGPACLEEHLAIAETLLLSSLPNPTARRQARQDTQNALSAAMGILPGSEALEKALGPESSFIYPPVEGSKSDFVPWQDEDHCSFAALILNRETSSVYLRNFITADCVKQQFRWIDNGLL